MNASWYDGELRLAESRALARNAAASYLHAPSRRRAIRPAALVLAGGALIALGRRLQGEMEELAVAPALDLGRPRQMPSR